MNENEFFTHNEIIEFKNSENFLNIHNLIIVGSTCVGKSTIVDAVRNCKALSDFVSVPKRCITRPIREKDNLIENKHITTDDFLKKVEAGEIDLHWIRKMNGNREETYGFEKNNENKINIYSGNNAFYDNKKSVFPKNILNNSLVVGVYAPDNVRERRLKSRSPDLFRDKPEEVKYRLKDSSNNMFPHIDVIVNNFGKFETDACRAMIDFVRKIVEKNIS